MGSTNFATQNVVLLGVGLDEAYMVRLVPEVPPEFPGMVRIFALFGSIFMGAFTTGGSWIGYVIAWVKRRRR